MLLCIYIYLPVCFVVLFCFVFSPILPIKKQKKKTNKNTLSYLSSFALNEDLGHNPIPKVTEAYRFMCSGKYSCHVTPFAGKRVPATILICTGEVISDETRKFHMGFLYFACVKLLNFFSVHVLNLVLTSGIIILCGTIKNHPICKCVEIK